MEHRTIQSIEKYNEGRIPDLLGMKYKLMREDIFNFFRGTAHLFYEDVPKNRSLYNCPTAWICGDLHFENFGSYKGENGQVYFDITDFDEGALAPCLFDISRFLISLRLVAELSKVTSSEAEKLCELFIDTYCQTLITGNSRWVEKETAKGLVKDLLKRVDQRKSIAEIYSDKKGGSRELDFKNKKLIKPTEEEKVVIKKLISEWNKQNKAKSVYEIEDIGYHLKGTGSLGIERYVLLVNKKKNGKFKLIDLKMATPSCVLPAIQITQPKWKNEAERTIEIQKRVQGTYQALLNSIELFDKSYTVREYQSSEDKMNYQLLEDDIKKIRQVVTTMAQVTAWGQLQSSSRQGSASTDEFIDFGLNQKKWEDKILIFTKEYLKKVKEDFTVFCEAYDKKINDLQLLTNEQ
jgi:uncharacterized protein (DUF2252 family)